MHKLSPTPRRRCPFSELLVPRSRSNEGDPPPRLHEESQRLDAEDRLLDNDHRRVFDPRRPSSAYTLNSPQLRKLTTAKEID
jgi:hypothetical protein